MNKTIFEWIEIMDVIGVDNKIYTPNQKAASPSLPSLAKRQIKLKELSKQPKRVKNELEIGNFGENVANIYLTYKYPDDEVKQKPDYVGYDFEVGDLCFEVKTSISEEGKAKFYMSNHEIKICLENENKYRILFVQLNSNDWNSISAKTFNLFQIKDIYKLFENYRQTLFKESLVSVLIDSVKIELDITAFECIDYPFSDEQINLLKTAIPESEGIVQS